MGMYRAGIVIRRNRLALHMTQEDLCDGICDTQTISRIENGKQNPGKDTYRKLMERMGREKDRAFAMVSGEDVRVMDYAREYENALHKFEYEKADEFLSKLEPLVDDSPNSRQYVMGARAIVDWSLKRVTPQEGRERLKEALSITMEEADQKDFSSYPLMRNEVRILCNIANTYFIEGELRKAVALLESIYEGTVSGYRIPEKKRILELFILDNITNMYGELGEHKRAIEIAKQGIKICKEEKTSSVLPQLLGEIEWNMEQMLEKGEETEFSEKDCEKILRQAYYIATALNQNHNAKLIEKHYMEYFKKSL
ncbi:MAG: helix-turn-helix domain-containing protein [Lachnospiraceae bacterium]|nr:helix-turn-helix domain-containing protein [Lachnospiraceae bacterium]